MLIYLTPFVDGVAMSNFIPSSISKMSTNKPVTRSSLKKTLEVSATVQEEERRGWVGVLLQDLTLRWYTQNAGQEDNSLSTSPTKNEGPTVTDKTSFLLGGRESTRCEPKEKKLASLWRCVTRSTLGSETPPDVGQMCLVIKGDTDKDLGRMAVVLRCTSQRVWVGYRNTKTGREEERLKTPGSLVLLEDGLEARNDQYGRLWIMRSATANV